MQGLTAVMDLQNEARALQQRIHDQLAFELYQQVLGLRGLAAQAAAKEADARRAVVCAKYGSTIQQWAPLYCLGVPVTPTRRLLDTTGSGTSAADTTGFAARVRTSAHVPCGWARRTARTRVLPLPPRTCRRPSCCGSSTLSETTWQSPGLGPWPPGGPPGTS